MSNLQPGHKIFPIKTETACLLKWSWSTINLQEGHTSSCHRVTVDPITVNNFSNFHNLPEKVRARELMLDGQWPGRGCEYCEIVERSGGTSDRIMTLSRSHTIDKVPPELLINPTATTVTPTILEVYFDNTCNMSCIYCSPTVSSKFNDEIAKHGNIDVGGVFLYPLQKNHNMQQSFVRELWKYLGDNQRYLTLRHFNVLGGEPFLQKELDETIEFWRQHPNPSLTINLITNLMTPPAVFEKKMKQFQALVDSNCIYGLEITASIDCWGPEQEYVRWGLDLNQWETNLDLLLKLDWVNLSIHSCINALTIKTMPELIAKINSWNRQRSTPIDFSFDLVVGDNWRKIGMHPMFFGPGVFDQDFENILELMPNSTESQQSSKQQMLGIAQLIKASPLNIEKIYLFQQYLDVLDQRRGTNWRGLFPWLDRNWD